MFIPTFVSSALGHKEIDDLNEQTLLTMGGACCLILSKETLAANIEAARATGIPEVIESMEAVPKNSPYVVIWDKLADFLGEEYTNAILQHEFAHAELGHVQKRVEANKLGIDEDLQEELEADALAASRVSAKTMARALLKTTEFIVDMVLLNDPSRQHEREAILDYTIANTSMIKRLEALRDIHKASK